MEQDERKGRAKVIDDLTRRAMGAYYRAGGDVAFNITGRVARRKGKRYVVLSDVDNGVLAVYRERTDGVLKRLRRWPAGLEESS